MTQPIDIGRVPGAPPRLLALCAGYGGLEAAVRAGIGGDVAAFAENDPYAAKVFAAHHPGVSNLGDITAVDWHQVRDLYAPDVVGAGFPCRNISNAGRRDGIHGQWSRVWKNVAEAVGVLRPRLVFLENVAALRSRGLDVVAADLAALGYDARWTCLRAGDPEIGAPHPRDRWFSIAHPADADPHHLGRHWRTRHITETTGRDEPAHRRHTPAGTATGSLTLLPTPAARDWKSGASNLLGRNSRPLNEVVVNLLPTPKASDEPHGGPNQRDTSGRYYLPGQAVRLDERWVAVDGTDYGPAIRRWEHITGRTAPCPTEPGTRGNRRLSPAFAEWLMGLPAGWVTAIDGIPRKEQLKILGNGVVPQQAHHAYRLLLGAPIPASLEGRTAA
ncbi:DNA cytosine methyltransferase [Streptomyces lunaelactis]|uniref:DNA cytosine methyltransferase n=1 Tax=Streptomyces lunaelactis TaxID=1535768 RepID=UPI001584A9EA|nr:DNA cytosine methyltransferase [Streptomyces lunaelactis]NUK08624.1 DNA cytosine methyltransferase [Streptomyces lunaelactis]NUL12829.1 DNA cytosine methyltransferase [Streptomyces lunaelactis]NUL25950.1 DNA cytosine methyltransferase [Streptomyces lunaelactis]